MLAFGKRDEAARVCGRAPAFAAAAVCGPAFAVTPRPDGRGVKLATASAGDTAAARRAAPPLAAGDDVAARGAVTSLAAVPAADDAAVARVYGAAMAAAADARAAEDATFRVFAAAGLADAGTDARAAAAIRLVVRAAPHESFARMEPGDREAIALARLLGWTEGRVGEVLEIDVREVRRRFVRGLRASIAGSACAA